MSEKLQEIEARLTDIKEKIKYQEAVVKDVEDGFYNNTSYDERKRQAETEVNVHKKYYNSANKTIYGRDHDSERSYNNSINKRNRELSTINDRIITANKKSMDATWDEFKHYKYVNECKDILNELNKIRDSILDEYNFERLTNFFQRMHIMAQQIAKESSIEDSDMYNFFKSNYFRYNLQGSDSYEECYRDFMYTFDKNFRNATEEYKKWGLTQADIEKLFKIYLKPIIEQKLNIKLDNKKSHITQSANIKSKFSLSKIIFFAIIIFFSLFIGIKLIASEEQINKIVKHIPIKEISRQSNNLLQYSKEKYNEWHIQELLNNVFN